MSIRKLAVSILAVLPLLLILGCAPKKVIKQDIVYPPPPEKPRVKHLVSIYGKSDLMTGKYSKLKETLAGQESAEKIIKPYGVACDDRDRIYVADAGNRAILVFDDKAQKESEVLQYVGVKGMGQLVEPAGVAVDDKGNVYVSDVKLNKVNMYGPDFVFIRTIGEKGVYTRPSGLAYNRVSHELIVVDTKESTLKVFNDSGAMVRTIGTKGMENGQFNLPTNVACDPAGKIYVVDAMNFRIQIFDKDGKYESQFGAADNVPGSFSRPRGLAIDSEGNIYVSDGAFDNIQIFQPDGTLLLFFGSAGPEDGQFHLPAGLCFTKDDRLVVADQYNKRVQVFQYIKYKE